MDSRKLPASVPCKIKIFLNDVSHFVQRYYDIQTLSMILPGGGKAATFLHAARTICRRAERSLVFLNESEEVRPELIKYLNRLSDYLFVLARYISKINNEPEEYWNPNER